MPRLIAAVAEGRPCLVDPADTAWVLISTMLVLTMNAALALFEAGLLRAKNTLSVVTQIWAGVISLSCLWAMVGYSLVFSGSGAYMGDLNKAFFNGVSYTQCPPNTNSPIPEAAFAAFMNMFAVITPLMMTGAYAERFKFHASLLLSLFWEVLVFYPIARWVWHPNGWLNQMGALDFAGGIVIHSTAGSSSLLIAYMIGPRKDFDKYTDGQFPPSNVPLASVGATLLWLGWFGFNAGSALKSDGVGTAAVVNTHLAASASGLVWMLSSMLLRRGKMSGRMMDRGKPSSVAVINGVIAGLAGVTAACGFIDSGPALGLGFILGLSSFLGAYFVKRVLKIDDALDVSCVHGLTGVVGALFVGLFAARNINSTIQYEGLFYGESSSQLLVIQLLAVGVAVAWSLFWTLLIMLGLRKTIKWRFSEESERNGLDWRDLHEKAYNDLFDGKSIHMSTTFQPEEEDPPSSSSWETMIGGPSTRNIFAPGDACDGGDYVPPGTSPIPAKESPKREKPASRSLPAIEARTYTFPV